MKLLLCWLFLVILVIVLFKVDRENKNKNCTGTIQYMTVQEFKNCLNK